MARIQEPGSSTFPGGTDRTLRIVLLGGFELVGGQDSRPLTEGSERLLAFVALHRRPVGRLLVAGSLWSEVAEDRAYAALRSALIRLDRSSRRSLLVTASSLEMAQGVAVDLREAQALAHRLLGPAPPADADLSGAAVISLSVDLLPDWDEEWARLEAEDWHQRRLHALEAIVCGLVAAHRYGDAVLAAEVVVKADPLRESAQTALIRVYLADGNHPEALRTYDAFSRLLQNETSLFPTRQLRRLVAGRDDNERPAQRRQSD